MIPSRVCRTFSHISSVWICVNSSDTLYFPKSFTSSNFLRSHIRGKGNPFFSITSTEHRSCIRSNTSRTLRTILRFSLCYLQNPYISEIKFCSRSSSIKSKSICCIYIKGIWMFRCKLFVTIWPNKNLIFTSCINWFPKEYWIWGKSLLPSSESNTIFNILCNYLSPYCCNIPSFITKWRICCSNIKDIIRSSNLWLCRSNHNRTSPLGNSKSSRNSTIKSSKINRIVFSPYNQIIRSLTIYSISHSSKNSISFYGRVIVNLSSINNESICINSPIHTKSINTSIILNSNELRWSSWSMQYQRSQILNNIFHPIYSHFIFVFNRLSMTKNSENMKN